MPYTCLLLPGALGTLIWSIRKELKIGHFVNVNINLHHALSNMCCYIYFQLILIHLCFKHQTYHFIKILLVKGVLFLGINSMNQN